VLGLLLQRDRAFDGIGRARSVRGRKGRGRTTYRPATVKVEPTAERLRPYARTPAELTTLILAQGGRLLIGRKSCRTTISEFTQISES
jgi:hypothetical protein